MSTVSEARTIPQRRVVEPAVPGWRIPVDRVSA